MRVTKKMGRNAPIKIEQCTLNKFFPELLKPKEHGLIRRLKQINNLSVNERYTLRMKHDGTIYIKEEYCLNCGKRIIKIGYNRRIVILADGLGKHEFRIHRKRCPYCGEIKPDYSKLAPKNGNYHESYKRRARQHYMEGLMPSQIQRVFRIDYSIKELPKLHKDKMLHQKMDEIFTKGIDIRLLNKEEYISRLKAMVRRGYRMFLFDPIKATTEEEIEVH